MKTLLLVCALVAASVCFNLKGNTIISEDQGLRAIDWPFTICANGTWTIEKLTLGSTPTRNTNDDIDFLGTAGSSVTFKNVALGVKLNGVPLHTENIDFTDSYDDGDTVEFKYKNYIPSFAPSGKYDLTFNFYNDGGSVDGCASFSFKL